MGLRAMLDRTPGQITRPRQAPKILNCSVVPVVLDILRVKALLAARRAYPRASDMRHAEDVCMR
jgi:hypothetical protein